MKKSNFVTCLAAVAVVFGCALAGQWVGNEQFGAMGDGIEVGANGSCGKKATTGQAFCEKKRKRCVEIVLIENDEVPEGTCPICGTHPKASTCKSTTSEGACGKVTQNVPSGTEAGSNVLYGYYACLGTYTKNQCFEAQKMIPCSDPDVGGIHIQTYCATDPEPSAPCQGTWSLAYNDPGC